MKRLVLILLLLLAATPAEAGWLAEATFRPSAGTGLFGSPRRTRAYRSQRPAKGYRNWTRHAR